MELKDFQWKCKSRPINFWIVRQQPLISILTSTVFCIFYYANMVQFVWKQKISPFEADFPFSIFGELWQNCRCLNFLVRYVLSVPTVSSEFLKEGMTLEVFFGTPGKNIESTKKKKHIQSIFRLCLINVILEGNSAIESCCSKCL